MKIFMTTTMALGIMISLEASQPVQAIVYQPDAPVVHQAHIEQARGGHGGGGGHWHGGGGHWHGGGGHWHGGGGGGGFGFYPAYPYDTYDYYDDSYPYYGPGGISIGFGF